MADGHDNEDGKEEDDDDNDDDDEQDGGVVVNVFKSSGLNTYYILSKPEILAFGGDGGGRRGGGGGGAIGSGGHFGLYLDSMLDSGHADACDTFPGWSCIVACPKARRPSGATIGNEKGRPFRVVDLEVWRFIV